MNSDFKNKKYEPPRLTQVAEMLSACVSVIFALLMQSEIGNWHSTGMVVIAPDSEITHPAETLVLSLRVG